MPLASIDNYTHLHNPTHAHTYTIKTKINNENVEGTKNTINSQSHLYSITQKFCEVKDILDHLR